MFQNSLSRGEQTKDTSDPPKAKRHKPEQTQDSASIKRPEDRQSSSSKTSSKEHHHRHHEKRTSSNSHSRRNDDTGSHDSSHDDRRHHRDDKSGRRKGAAKSDRSETRPEKQPARVERKDCWLCSNLRVKMVDRSLKKRYNTKVRVYTK